MAEHSCLLGATRNGRVMGNVVVEKIGDMMAAMPILKPKHLEALVRKNARCLALKKIEQQFIEDFKVLNKYALELNKTNLESNVIILAERQSP